MSKRYELQPWAEEALNGIVLQQSLMKEAQAATDRLVAHLREGFCPWSEIGSALGVSAQAAHHRYRS